ncbi:Rossmann-fold NAD(P)-binding domain-containing protein [Hydrotalea sandarakina]|jgi:N-succinyl-L-ornithine transcarbamylase|uniref:N-succinylornithine carbamoyltransferase n=1 Tax=Hydrotalea sandarakina TaxID=1004304 RepID=A0A2W7RJS2_9BACT|nr:acetylornithine carbamoyltransferase [Hydrotalea sandarakina]PZX60511.1 N-succinyl-L-ornithine transcarbamylase [Hydrotalea sandarakina]
MKQFISVYDVITSNNGNINNAINQLVNEALTYKSNPLKDNTLGNHLRLGMLFLNPSLRTRLSTQVAAANLGMETIVFNVDKEGWALEFEEGAIMSGNTVEHIKDAAPILGSYFDILAIRTFPSLKNRADDYSELYIQQFIKYAGVPVISLESATLHPLQSLTDIITIQENRLHKAATVHKKPKVVLTWAPHVKALPQCVANSFAQWVNAWGEADFVITHPEDYALDEQFTKGATITHNQAEALKDADYVYVKNWSTYNDYGKVYENDPAWMLTNETLALTNNAKVLHCLPVRRNVELSDEILDGPNSLITTEAGNRVWAAQAVLANIIKTMKKG